jgi:hypothetical protein
MIHQLEHLGVYGGGADERVEHHGGTGGSSVCPRGSVYRMDEIRVLLKPPRGSVSLLGGATSSSIIQETRRTSASSKSLMIAPSMIVSSWWRNWWPSSILLLH